MASLISHAVAAVAIGAAFAKPGIPKRVWVVGAALSMFPDIDVIGFRFGVHYGDFWGHRGFTHSLLFAATLSTFVAAKVVGQGSAGLGRMSMRAYFFLATASHGVLDGMTNGGLGVAFLSPFDDTRYFFPWRPIAVSPISVTAFFTRRGLLVLESELCWIWLPAAVFALVVLALRHALGKTQARS